MRMPAPGPDVEVAPDWNDYSFDLRRARVPGGNKSDGVVWGGTL
jgi:hypothetical protein